jgi:hypothetical protein
MPASYRDLFQSTLASFQDDVPSTPFEFLDGQWRDSRESWPAKQST